MQKLTQAVRCVASTGGVGKLWDPDMTHHWLVLIQMPVMGSLDLFKTIFKNVQLVLQKKEKLSFLLWKHSGHLQQLHVYVCRFNL